MRGRPDALVTVMLHADLLSGMDSSAARLYLMRLDSLLTWLGEQDGITVTTVGKMARIIEDASPARFRAYNGFRKAWLFLPDFISPTLPRELYLAKAELDRLRMRGWVMTAGLYGTILLLTAVIIRQVMYRRIAS